MPKAPFEVTWSRIVAHAGKYFRTKTGLEFTYRVEKNVFRPSRTDYGIARSDFEKAYDLVPLSGPGEITSLVRGPSYVWAVLHDPRIARGEW